MLKSSYLLSSFLLGTNLLVNDSKIDTATRITVYLVTYSVTLFSYSFLHHRCQPCYRVFTLKSLHHVPQPSSLCIILSESNNHDWSYAPALIRGVTKTINTIDAFLEISIIWHQKSHRTGPILPKSPKQTKEGPFLKAILPKVGT